MTKLKMVAVPVFLTALFFSTACNLSATADASSIATDSLSVAAGSQVFTQHCSGCHNFKQDGIGPNLSGITVKVSPTWISAFIHNPKAMLNAGDKRAKTLFQNYHTLMPAFSFLSDETLQQVISFLHTHQAPPLKKDADDSLAIKNPLPDSIAFSGTTAGLKLVAQLPPSDTVKPRTRIAKLDYAPQVPGLFILDQRGMLYKLAQQKPTVFLNMATWKPAFINQPGLATGFGSFAFHPDFKKNGLFYTSHTEAAHTKKADFSYADSIKVTLQWVVSEWKATDPKTMRFAGTCRELLRVDMVAGIHGVQELAFNPLAKKGDEDYGMLYIGVGDGGSVENGYPFLAHQQTKIWGTILRIDPAGRSSSNGQYGIPEKNPFSQRSNAAKEMYAYGFRNPNRITWLKNGTMLATNIGQAQIEAVNMISKGGDYGWPLREGAFVLNAAGNMSVVYPLPANDSTYHFTYPVVQYDHDEGKAISGGFVYEGREVSSLRGQYLFGDVPSGRLFQVAAADLKKGAKAVIKEWRITAGGKETTLHALCGSDRVDLHFGRDEQGELYLLTKPDGKVYQLVAPGE